MKVKRTIRAAITLATIFLTVLIDATGFNKLLRCAFPVSRGPIRPKELPDRDDIKRFNAMSTTSEIRQGLRGGRVLKK